MKEIKGLIFDKDGTLFDFAATWEAWATAFLLRAAAGDRARARHVGSHIGFDLDAQKFDRDSVVIAGTAGEVSQALHVHFPEMTLAQMSELLDYEAERAPQEQAVPLDPLLRGLRDAGFALGVATNDSERPARAHLMQAGVQDHFDFIVGFDSGFGGKPAPGQLLAFAEHTGLDPTAIAMVGDSTHDLHAGRAAGMHCVGVLTGLADADELSPFADVVLPDIGHLPAWLSGAGQ